MKRIRLKAFIYISALLIGAKAAGQTPGLGTWNILNGEFEFSNKWSAFAEVQLRSQKFFGNFNYHELKTGVSYKPSQNIALLIGTGQYVTYDPTGNFKSPVETSELRVWEQLTLTNNIERVKLEHRYRIEQRYTGANYRNRFRYRLNTVIPVNNNEMEKNTFFITASGEVFITNTRPYFERTRLFGGAGYVFSDVFTLQMGWLHQFDYRKDHTTSQKNYFQTALLFDINHQQTDRKPHPSPMD